MVGDLAAWSTLKGFRSRRPQCSRSSTVRVLSVWCLRARRERGACPHQWFLPCGRRERGLDGRSIDGRALR
eukprot:2496019-Pleurochrysis_carterae.AAC.1